jgi:DNA-directed RNA polymerase subunit alpha
MMWQYQAAKQVEDKKDDGKPMNRLDVYIEHTPMSLRTQNCLKRAGIQTLGDLVQRTMRDIMNVRGLGQAGLFDIEEVLKTYGLQFRRNIKT